MKKNREELTKREKEIVKLAANSSVSFTATQFILFDVTGRKCLQILNSKFQTPINVSHLQQGIYFYAVRDKEGKAVYGKVVKQ